MKRILLIGIFIFLISTLSVIQSYACTIFVLTDRDKTLFFNNEDYTNSVTRIWFLPASKEHYGVAYVGFDNNWAQGGINSEGLAFDWVSGFQEQYVPNSKLSRARSNPSEKMLQTCASVSEAITFYKKYREPSFAYAKIMIVDKSGFSVIIGARNGELYFDTSSQSRGFGYGERLLNDLLTKSTRPDMETGFPILQACYQQGEYATKYSSVYDLRSSEIFLVLPDSQKTIININLPTELAKGRHYYDMSDIKKQLSEAPRQISRIKRFITNLYLYFKY